jgi:hypothetical protein
VSEILPLNQAVDALGGFSIDEEGGIFLIFLIHSAALCSTLSNCSIVMDWLRWFLAWVIYSPAIRNHIYECTTSCGPALRAAQS